MRSLWLTLADPHPATNGQFLYSSGLIQAVASAVMEVHAVGLGRLGAQHRNGQQRGGIRWWLAEHEGRSKWAALLSGQTPLRGARGSPNAKSTAEAGRCLRGRQGP